MTNSPASASNQGLRIDVCDIGSHTWTELFEIESVSELPGLTGGTYEKTRLNQKLGDGSVDRKKKKAKGNVDVGKFDIKAGFADGVNDDVINTLYYEDKRYRVVFSNGSRFIASGWIGTAVADGSAKDGETLLHVVIECDGDEVAFKPATDAGIDTD